MQFQLEYVRGITQHDVVCKELEHISGTEMILKLQESNVHFRHIAFLTTKTLADYQILTPSICRNRATS